MDKLDSMKSLVTHLEEMREYLENVCAGKLPVNQEIISNIQDMFNLLPNVAVDDLVRAFAVTQNDSMLVIYLSSMIRSVIALHSLINNKIANRQAELKYQTDSETDKEKEEKEKEEKEEKEKEEKEKEEKENGADSADQNKSAKQASKK
jgi:26S proteasome regulatory subunit N8